MNNIKEITKTRAINKTKIALFISGRGTNLKSLFYFSKKKKSKVQICIVISNKKYAKGLDFAKKHNIKFQTYTFKNSLRDELKVLQILNLYGFRNRFLIKDYQKNIRCIISVLK